MSATVACSDAQPTWLPPIGYVLLYVNTDAPLPARAGESLGPQDHPALFDRVRIDVYRPGERSPCPDCTNELEIDRTIVGEGRASVGFILPPHVPGYVARVRLFRAAFVELGVPREDTTIDVTVALPAIEPEGTTPITVMLRTEDVARKIGTLDAPALPQPGPAAPGIAGTWRGARRAPCTGAAGPGEVCVPGGSYWMGNPRLKYWKLDEDALVMRLVNVSPFFLDATEVTVSAFRAANLATTTDPIRYFTSAGDGGGNPTVHCTYTQEVGNYEALPLNCVSWAKAREYCAARDGDLPTEAQLQYAASGLEGHLYPWGDDTPGCEDAVFSRARGIVFPETRCPGAWVSAPGSARRDRLELEGGTIVDLAGNLSERTLDAFALQGEPCWRTGVFFDPVCEEPTTHPALERGAHTVLAGSFVEPAATMAAAARRPDPPFAKAIADQPGGPLAHLIGSIGFRCARRGTP